MWSPEIFSQNSSSDTSTHPFPQNLAMAGSLYPGHSMAFVGFTLLGALDTLQPVFMLSAALPKSSAWDLTFKSCFWGLTALWWQCLHGVLHVYCFWSPSVLLREAGLHCCSPQRIKRNEGRCNNSSGPILQQEVGKMQVGNCYFCFLQNLASHGKMGRQSTDCYIL